MPLRKSQSRTRSRSPIRRSERSKRSRSPIRRSRRSKRSRSPIRIPLRKGILGKFGYKDIQYLSQQHRRDALKMALKNGEPPLSLYRRLIALATMNKNKNKHLYKIFREDAAYIKRTSEYKLQ